MKKITILFVALFAFMMATATAADTKTNPCRERLTVKQNQQFKKTADVKFRNEKQSSSNSSAFNRSTQAPFFSEVFAGGIPPTWQNIDSSGSGVYWTWTTSGTYIPYPGQNDSLSVSGTSANNGYMMFDSDSAQGTAQGEYGVLITDAIDCSMHSTVRVNFNEYFSLYNAATPIYMNTGRVYISTDGSTWTLIHSADDGLVFNGDETSNPNAVSINISSIAAGQATVYFKFSFTGHWSFWWFLDDLELSEVPSLDAGLFGILDPFNGCQLSNAEQIVVGVSNDGVDTISSIPVYYSINGGVPVAEVIPDTLAPGDSMIYVFSTTEDMSFGGSYSIVSYVAIPGDLNTANDTASISTASYDPNTAVYTMGFEFSDDYTGYTTADVDGDFLTVDISSTYSRTGLFCLRFPLPVDTIGDNWLITNCFDFQSANTYNLDFWFKVFDVSPAIPYNLEAYIGDSPDISTMTLLAAPAVPGDTSYTNVNTNFTVPSDGLYYIAFRAFGNNVDNTLRIDDITVDFATGIKKPLLNEAVLVYPNPSHGNIFIVNKGLKNEAATITVMNTIGQIVKTISTSNFVQESVDLSAQPEGLYTVQVRTGSGVITKNVMVSSK